MSVFFWAGMVVGYFVVGILTAKVFFLVDRVVFDGTEDSDTNFWIGSTLLFWPLVWPYMAVFVLCHYLFVAHVFSRLRRWIVG